ncbi:Protein O-mannose kinase [Halotydeus destructor]|nr:Protein O-mannose kinase [Halotydeus destructor]
MEHCHKFLDCQDFQDIKIKTKLSEGAVKQIFLANWKGNDVVLSKLQTPMFKDDFDHNIRMLQAFSGSNYVTQYIGLCNDELITQYHSNGDALNYHWLMKSETSSNDGSLQQCLKFCISYATVIEFLHNSPLGVRVMCDSNDLAKLLSQFLITEHHELLANDLDALPEVKRDGETEEGIICGPHEITGSFPAPEQLWTRQGHFDVTRMKAYNEKTDIWKMADVCEYFLKACHVDSVARASLNTIHAACKSIEPNQRPTASQVRRHYESLKQ